MSKGSFAVIGQPVAHSLSPLVQELITRHSGVRVKYKRYQSTVINLREFVVGLSKNVSGINVTSPFKGYVSDMTNQHSPRVLVFRTVNTMKHWEGQSFSDNTDGCGIANDVRTRLDELTNGIVLLFGSGGTAKSMALGLLGHYPQRICLAARDLKKIVAVAKELCHLMKRVGTRISCHRLCNTTILKPQLIINATPVNPLSFFGVRKVIGAITYDIGYSPSKSEFLMELTPAVMKAINGVGMLVQQASESFRLWNAKRLRGKILVEISQSIVLCCSVS